MISVKWRVKLVPDAEPNADGRWVTRYGPEHFSSWSAAELFFMGYGVAMKDMGMGKGLDAPSVEHMVDYERIQPND